MARARSFTATTGRVPSPFCPVKPRGRQVLGTGRRKLAWFLISAGIIPPLFHLRAPPARPIPFFFLVLGLWLFYLRLYQKQLSGGTSGRSISTTMDFAKLNIGAVQSKALTAKETSKAVSNSISSETAYWRRFRAPIFLKEHAPITSIHYVPASALATTGPEAAAGERAVANPLFSSFPGSHPGTSSASQAAQRYAVTAGPRVQLFSTRTDKVVKTVSRFKDVARSAHIRSDGRLMVAGDDSGLVQVFDINSRAILRTFRGHKQWVFGSFPPFFFSFFYMGFHGVCVGCETFHAWMCEG